MCILVLTFKKRKKNDKFVSEGCVQVSAKHFCNIKVVATKANRKTLTGFGHHLRKV